MKRVMIVGGPGSGKSTLAIELSKRSGLTVYHMDHIHYESGWIERSQEQKDRLSNEIHMLDSWIFEGGHSRTYAQRVQRADTFIWLDFPVWLRIFRVLRRSVQYYGRSRPDLPEGCPEQFNFQTFEFLRFIWRTRKASKLLEIYNNPPAHLRAYRIDSNEAAKDLLDRITNSTV